MAQTTAGLSGVVAYIAINTSSGGAYTDISGVANTIAFSGYDRQSGETYTFNGDKAIVKFGKLSPSEATVTIVFSETITEPFGVLYGYHVATGGTGFYLRYQPNGSSSTKQQFTSDKGKITAMLPPEGAAAPGDPLTTTFTFHTSGWAQKTSS